MDFIDEYRIGIAIFFIILLSVVFILIIKQRKSEQTTSMPSEQKPLSRKKFISNHFLIITLISVIILIVLAFLFDFTDKVGSYIATVFVITLILSIVNNMFFTNEFKKYILNSFAKRYGNAKSMKNPKKEIIEGKPTELGCKRKEYQFNINISKYNCNIQQYYVQKLIDDSGYIGDDYVISYKYKNIKRVTDYIYYIDKNACALLKNPENIQKLTNALTEKQIINIDVYDSCVIFSKEVSLNNYLEDAIEQDAEDVYVFLREIDKLIKEEGEKYASKI